LRLIINALFCSVNVEFNFVYANVYTKYFHLFSIYFLTDLFCDSLKQKKRYQMNETSFKDMANINL